MAFPHPHSVSHIAKSQPPKGTLCPTGRFRIVRILYSCFLPFSLFTPSPNPRSSCVFFFVLAALFCCTRTHWYAHTNTFLPLFTFLSNSSLTDFSHQKSTHVYSSGNLNFPIRTTTYPSHVLHFHFYVAAECRTNKAPWAEQQFLYTYRFANLTLHTASSLRFCFGKLARRSSLSPDAVQ